MKLRFVFGLAAFAIAWPQISSAQIQPVQLEPTSGWKFEAQSDACRISRSFGEGEQSTEVWIEQSGSQSPYNFTFVGRHLTRPMGPLLRLRFNENAANLRTHVKTMADDGRPALSVFGVTMGSGSDSYDSDTPLNIDNISAENTLSNAQVLRVDRAARQPLLLAMGQMGEPLAQLELCSRDLSIRLQTAWSAAEEGANPPISIDENEWFEWRDFPRELQMTGGAAATAFRLTIDSVGKPTDCQIVGTDNAKMYTGRICSKLRERALLKPARNAKGEAIASYFYSCVIFALRKKDVPVENCAKRAL